MFTLVWCGYKYTHNIGEDCGKNHSNQMEKIDTRKNKILIFGGSGYIGSYMVKASLKLGHPTYVFSRPNSSKTHLLNHFQSLGAIIVKVFLSLFLFLFLI